MSVAQGKCPYWTSVVFLLYCPSLATAIFMSLGLALVCGVLYLSAHSAIFARRQNGVPELTPQCCAVDRVYFVLHIYVF